MDESVALSKNKIVKFLNKPQKEFTLTDIIKYVCEEDIQMINFMYPADDGRLKTLNFVINDLDYLRTILTQGERVDGSSLFSYVDPSNSDLYVVPRFNTAFVDPFAEIPTVAILCSFFDKEGKPLDISSEYTLKKACDDYTRVTGYKFEAMGELEFYVISTEEKAFPAIDQKGYHESSPFAKFNEFRTKCMLDIASAGGRVKYGHSEVGNFTENGMIYEQNEIEFLPVTAIDAADQLVIAKWIIRCNAAKHGYNVTFAPKITVGKAGSGLHIHMRTTNKDGKNLMLNAKGKLSEQAHKMIAGMMTLAPSIAAFGNTIPTSYFRLVPHQEAPTTICWGDRNRSVLVRVPLGWTSTANMCRLANPLEDKLEADVTGKQTIEIRSADASADVYLLIASLAVACRSGFEMSNAEKVANDTYVDIDIHKTTSEKVTSLGQLPRSCAEAAEYLRKQRSVYEKNDVFSAALIDGILNKLESQPDDKMITKVRMDNELMKEIVERHFYCG